MSLFFLLNFLSLNAQKSIEFEYYFVDTLLVNKRISTNGYLDKFHFKLIDENVLLIDNGMYLLKNGAKIKLSENFLPSKEQLAVYKDNLGIEQDEFLAVMDDRVFENHRYFFKSNQLIKQAFGSSEFAYIPLEYGFDVFYDIIFDNSKRRAILNGREGDKYFYTIVSIDNLTILAQGKGNIHISPVSSKYYVQKDFDLYQKRDFATLVEMDSENLKTTKKLKGEILHYDYNTKLFDINLDDNSVYDFDLINVGTQFIILARNKEIDNLNYYYLTLGFERNTFYSPKEHLLFYKSENKIFTKNLLNGEEKSVLEAEYIIHDIHINSDSTKIILFVDERNPTANKAKEIAEEKEKIRLIQEAEAKVLAEEQKRQKELQDAENKRLKEIKEAEEKIVAAENKRLNDLKIAEENRQRKIKDSISMQAKLKEQLARIDKYGFKLVEKNKALKKLELKNITFKEKGHGLFTDFKKSGKDEVYYIFNHEAIVVMDTKNNTTKLFEYPSSFAYGAEIRQMYNGLFIYSDFGNRKVYIIDLDKGMIRKTYSSIAENNPNVIFSQLGITNWFTESKYYLSFNLVGDSLVFNSEGNLQDGDKLYSNQMPDQKIDESKINFSEGLKFVVDRSQGISNFDSKTQKRGNVEWNSFMSNGKQSMYGFFFLGLYKYHSPSFYKDYIAFGSEYSISSIGTTDYYDLKGFYIDKDDKKIEKEDLPSLLLYNSSTGKKDYALHTVTDRYYHYTMDKLSVYSCVHKYYNMGPSFNDPSVIILTKSDEGHDYLFKMKDTTILQIYDLASAKKLELTSELRKIKGIYTLKKQSGILYNNINDVPRTQKWKDEQAYSEKRNREFEEKEAREKIQEQKNAEANKQRYQAKAIYSGYNSEYKLKIEVQANVIYVLEENADLLNQNKRVLYKNEIDAEGLYYRFPQNETKWFPTSSGSMYNCGDQTVFDPCISVNGMIFELGNPTYLE